ncbi:UNKNOWN [Stylonychia lemnae]|uniref:Uncharacterized protein n=1 Tax=Stylonychia lemnae TaxID=5949 RepID=A0A078AMS3_STYLE|nr:UNKNOWN [Stylonychia lemnae]|eukprot:CDW82677.1 UNKNOWN [Stylonychia lemnae]
MDPVLTTDKNLIMPQQYLVSKGYSQIAQSNPVFVLGQLQMFTKNASRSGQNINQLSNARCAESLSNKFWSRGILDLSQRG